MAKIINPTILILLEIAFTITLSNYKAVNQKIWESEKVVSLERVVSQIDHEGSPD
jgi:hypothetical protein